MKRAPVLLCLFVSLWLCAAIATAQDTVRAFGAVSVALPLVEAIPILRTEKGIELIVRASGGTEAGLDALGERTISLALSSRSLTPVDRSEYPGMQFTEIPIGVQVLAMAVSADVWAGGVRSLSATQAQAIYEGKITNWKDVGGPNLKIKVFMNEPGRGQWELFVQWLYGGIRKAPKSKSAVVREINETRNVVEFTPGSFALLPPSMTDGRTIFGLAAQDSQGTPIEPTLQNVLDEKYPLSRPLLLVIEDKPTGNVKTIVDLMISERGQAFVKQFGYITLKELRAAKAVK